MAARTVSPVVGAITSAVIAGGIAFVPPVHVDIHKFDLIGTLNKIASSNDRIGHINGGILGSLDNVNSATIYTEQANEKLTTLQGSLEKSVNRLEDLRKVTDQQVQLGNQLRDLSRQLVKTLTSIDSTTGVQYQKMSSLTTQTQKLAQTFGTVYKLNQDANSKLKDAALLTQEVDRSMPSLK
ncbi:hypothetical protein [Effusibacillus consociatus]|uniref:Uncharacterized protein n=1 Tax=Effusibacillus consociatus TaxID=1117041 RepID=A0ABV9Q020_9BACL